MVHGPWVILLARPISKQRQTAFSAAAMGTDWEQLQLGDKAPWVAGARGVVAPMGSRGSVVYGECGLPPGAAAPAAAGVGAP